MKRVQKFRADDGAEFDTEAACLEHEALCAEIDGVMATLPRPPADDGCRFTNGHGYIQHTPERFWPARDALLRIGNRLSPHKWFEQSLADREIHPSWCGRLIDETSRPLSRAWYRVMCVDKDLREWGQPYYANNANAPETIAKLERELAEARAECERLREDAARINWLEANPRHAQIIIDGETKDCVFYGISTHDLMPLRAAIDAARRK